MSHMRVGIIGSGFGLYGLLPAFNSLKECQVVAICGKKTDRLLSYCESIGLSKIYSSWEEMLDKEDLDAVAIAVIPSAQYHIAKKALEKGLHIFAEKPLTATYEQAKDLVVLAEKQGVTTVVDFIFPEIDQWQTVKKLIDSKVYGDLKHISVSWQFLSYDIKHGVTSWKTDVKEGGGALSFFGSHTLYYLEYFGGLIKDCKSVLSYSDEGKDRAEVEVSLNLVFESGATGDVHLACNVPDTHIHKLTFVCEDATLVLESNQGVTDYFTVSIQKDRESKPLEVESSSLSKNKETEDERVEVVARLAFKFIQGCLSLSSVTPNFTHGLRVQELIAEIRKSSLKE